MPFREEADGHEALSAFGSERLCRTRNDSARLKKGEGYSDSAGPDLQGSTAPG